MFGLNQKIQNYYLKRAFNRNSQTLPYTSYFDFWDNRPQWLSLSTPTDFEQAARFNPIVKSAINLLATASSNGKKVIVDSRTDEEISWQKRSEPVQKLKNLLIYRPNPLQSGKEFTFQGIFYLKTFGNRYVYGLTPEGFQFDLMNIEALYNLPSQFMQVRKTGKLYNQTNISGIISEYARTNVYPPETYIPENIIHFNEVNISSDAATIMGISKLEVLKYPITNTQKAFESMNTILESRGAQGILSIDSKDGQGSIIPLDPELKKETQDKFKNDYGLLNGQNPFLLSPVPLNYIKTIMSSKELGIYEEFSNNAIIIGNEFGVPPELMKTYIQGATYENQIQSVRRLYQDTVIPMVEDEDVYWNYRLNLEKYGFRLKTKWDHIPALSENVKEVATANSLNVNSALKEYQENLITWNDYLRKTNQEVLGNEGDKYKYEREREIGSNQEGQGVEQSQAAE